MPSDRGAGGGRKALGVGLKRPGLEEGVEAGVFDNVDESIVEELSH